MIKTYIYGISGKMGKTITECLPDDFALVGGADSRHTDKCGADVNNRFFIAGGDVQSN